MQVSFYRARTEERLSESQTSPRPCVSKARASEEIREIRTVSIFVIFIGCGDEGTALRRNERHYCGS